MSTGLSLNDIVNVTVSLSPTAAAARNFGNLLVVGSSGVIDVSERLRLYTSLTAIGTDFGSTAAEYLAAARFFGQSPQPVQCYVGAWAQTATKGLLHGGLLTAAQQLPVAWTGISTGSIRFTLDGTVRSLSSLDFTGVTGMTGVASVINTGLGANGTCTWNAVYNRLEIAGTATGAGTAASGTLTQAGQPSANDTVTIGGTAITFVASGATGPQVNIAGTAAATWQALYAFLIASADSNLVKFTYAINNLSTIITATAVTLVAATGNALTLAKSGTNLSISGSTLSGGVNAGLVTYATTTGSGVDISAQTALTAATGASVPVAGINAESAVAAVTALAAKSTDWYGVTLASLSTVDADRLAVAAFIEGTSPARIYGVSTQDANTLSASATSDVAYQLKALGYRRTFTQYSSTEPYSAASIFGRAFTVNFDGQNTTITIKFKQEPGIAPETVTESQAAAATAKNCNIFVNYDNSTAIVQQGVMCSGDYFDERHGLDWLQNRVQTDLYNLLYTSTTKIPQTDAGMNLIAGTIAGSCNAAVQNGLFAPGVWTGPDLGAIKNGQTLSTGFYVYAPPIASQSSGDRAARKSVAFQVAGKLAGAVHSAAVLLNVVR